MIDTFNTPFFVGLEEFPLPADDERRLPNSKFARRELICWRCQENFGHKYKELKEHLELEFEEWKKQPAGNTESGQTE
jgi:aprataxin